MRSYQERRILGYTSARIKQLVVVEGVWTLIDSTTAQAGFCHRSSIVYKISWMGTPAIGALDG